MNPKQDKHGSYNNTKSEYDYQRHHSDKESFKRKTVYFLPLERTLATRQSSGKADVEHIGEYNNRPSAELFEDSALLASASYVDRRNMTGKLRDKYDHMVKSRSVIVDILSIFFGIGTWIGINGTFIQLPLLVAVAPEAWSLPSYLSVMVQIGNLGPVTYTLLQRFSKTKKNDANIIYGLLAVGTTSSLLTAFFYNRTARVFGQEYSVALFVLTIFTAVNACTSSVCFMPYMGRFKEIYLVTYFVGEGLSGLLPSVVALIQGIGGAPVCVLRNVTETGEHIYEKYVAPPRFSSMEFFLFVFVMMLCSCIGFALLDRLKLSKQQYANGQVTSGNNYTYERDSKADDQVTIKSDGMQAKVNPDSKRRITTWQYRSLLLLITAVSFFSNGMLQSIQSYSCLPYGGHAYHLSATLSVIANPLVCFLAVFLPHTSLRAIATLSSFATILIFYVCLTAAMSPHPPLHGTSAGSVLVIISWSLLIGLVSYIKLCISTVMRAQGGKSLVWTGGLTQLGATIGSLFIFCLINFTNSFQAAIEESC